MRVGGLRATLVLPLLVLGWTAAALAADEDIVRAQLERYFHPATAVADLPAGDADALVDWLVITGRDRWARIQPAAAETGSGRRVASDGYGLRVLAREDGLFLVPVPGSPNSTTEHRLLEVLDELPESRLRAALDAGTLTLAEGGERITAPLQRKDFVMAPFALDGTVLRLDDFVGAGLDRAFERETERLSDVSIVDLRFNGGGRVGSAVRLLEVLIGDDLPFGWIERRDRTEPLGAARPERAPGSDEADVSGARDVPGAQTRPENDFDGADHASSGRGAAASGRAEGLTVLISRHTASAAEWAARVLQLEGARLLGERSEGKCLVHDVFPAGEGELIEFSVGRLGVYRHERTYDHCDFGLIPDLGVAGRKLIEAPAGVLVVDSERTRVCFARGDPDRLVAWQKELDLYLPPGRVVRLVVDPDGALCLAERFAADEAALVRRDILSHTRFAVRGEEVLTDDAPIGFETNPTAPFTINETPTD